MMLPTCREVTRKLAEGAYDESPWHGRLLVRLHLMMCEHCGRFARQLGLIAQGLRAAWSRRPEPGALDAAKRRILERLRGA